jgi:HEAT repeat protein
MPNPPRASECGVVLRLVARERKVALPFVLERLADADAERRGWATHLIGELPYVEALSAVLERLRDDDAATRASAALAVAAIARSHPGRVAQTLRERGEESDPRQRAVGMRAAGAVRDPALVPLLMRGLGDGDDAVVGAAHDALVQVTRQDFGTDARPWMKWWEQNSGRHRLEWLIDALTHDVSEVRRAAGDELRLLSRQYFGFSSDLPPRDRERAQQRYRDWWITEGRANHRRF